MIAGQLGFLLLVAVTAFVFSGLGIGVFLRMWMRQTVHQTLPTIDLTGLPRERSQDAPPIKPVLFVPEAMRRHVIEYDLLCRVRVVTRVEGTPTTEILWSERLNEGEVHYE